MLDLEPICSPCSVYHEYALRIEKRTVGGRSWVQISNWGEGQIDEAIAELNELKRITVPQLEWRIIRIRFEVVIRPDGTRAD